MNTFIKTAWSGVIGPILRRPPRVQVAALCWRNGKDGKEVLLATSRDTGRWILPKGWPIDGLDGAEAAAQEAWEEAGVKPAKIGKQPMGSYAYIKKLDNGAFAPVEANVYKIEVAKLAKHFPEADERERRWVRPEVAANMVAEPALQALLRDF